MEDLLKYYMEKFNITDKDVDKKSHGNPKMYRPMAKELIGNQIIKKYDLFDILFPENIGVVREVGVKAQKAGVDYIIYFPTLDENNKKKIYVDLKSLVGEDYHMTESDYLTDYMGTRKYDMIGAPVELYQNGIYTNSSSKYTDFVLYTFATKSGIYYSLVSYRKIQEISLANIREVVKDSNGETARWTWKGNIYKVHTSNNGSGRYIKVPFKTNQIVINR